MATIFGDVTDVQQRHHPQNIPHLVEKMKSFLMKAKSFRKIATSKPPGGVPSTKSVRCSQLFVSVVPTEIHAIATGTEIHAIFTNKQATCKRKIYFRVALKRTVVKIRKEIWNLNGTTDTNN